MKSINVGLYFDKTISANSKDALGKRWKREKNK